MMKDKINLFTPMTSIPQSVGEESTKNKLDMVLSRRDGANEKDNLE